MFELAQSQILLDRLNFISKIVAKEACPKCNFEKAQREVKPDMHPPYLRTLNLAHKFKPLWARNIADILLNNIDYDEILKYDRHVKKRSKVKVLILVDHS